MEATSSDTDASSSVSRAEAAGFKWCSLWGCAACNNNVLDKNILAIYYWPTAAICAMHCMYKQVLLDQDKDVFHSGVCMSV